MRCQLVEIPGGRKLKRCDAPRRILGQENKREVVQIRLIVAVRWIVDVPRSLDVLERLRVKVGRKRDVELRAGRRIPRDNAVSGCEEDSRSDEASGAPLVVAGDAVLAIVE